MRIAYVCADPGVPVFGQKGATVHVQEMIRAFRGLGAEVALFAARVDCDPPADLRSVRLLRLPRAPKGDAAAREQRCLRANDDLRAVLEGAEPCDMVYERYSLWSYAAMEYARENRLPGVLEVNAPLIEEQALYRRLVDRASAERIAERVFGAAQVLVAVSRAMAAFLTRYPAARGRIHVVPNGVNPRRFRPNIKPALPAPPDTFTVGFVGNLQPWHGVCHLVEAFALLHRRCPHTRLLVVGDGPEREALLVGLAARCPQAEVHLTGRVAAEQIPGLLASMDVAVAPYPKLAQFYFAPLKLCEYMAASLPVVASRIGHLAEVIEDGVNGILCPPGDAGAVAAALECLHWDPKLRTRLGQTARMTVLNGYTWEAAARRILGLAGVGPLAYPQ